MPHMRGQGICGKSLSSAQFCCEPKTALKKNKRISQTLRFDLNETDKFFKKSISPKQEI